MVTVTVNVPSDKNPKDYKTEIIQKQTQAKSTLLNDIKELGADVSDNDNKIVITILSTSDKSFDEIYKAVEKLQEEFNLTNKDNHITFGEITKRDGSSCSDYNTDGSHMRKKRSPARQRATGRKSPSRR